MKKKSVLSYAFAVGKIKVLEKTLLRAETFAQAMQLETGEALRLLAEGGFYGEELAMVRDSRQLEKVLADSLADLKQLLRTLLLDPALWGYLEIHSPDDAASLPRQYANTFLADYIAHLIDMHNIKTFLRLRVLAEGQEILDKKITREGFIPKNVFLKYYQADLALFLNQLGRVPKHGQNIDYGRFFKGAIEKAMNEKSFAALEKAQADFLLCMLQGAKTITFGPEPVLAYFFARVNEISLIRLLILGKLNRVRDEIIKERANAVYA
jgi:V/A-type H+/Na+-transporting ATPase subunit C